jgi:hypothetical protein
LEAFEQAATLIVDKIGSAYVAPGRRVVAMRFVAGDLGKVAARV